MWWSKWHLVVVGWFVFGVVDSALVGGEVSELGSGFFVVAGLEWFGEAVSASDGEGEDFFGTVQNGS